MEDAVDLVLITDDTPPSAGGPFVVYANASLQAATGFHLSDLMGRPHTVLLDPGNSPKTLQTFARNIEAGVVDEREMRIRRQDGSRFWCELTLRPIADDVTGGRYWLWVGRDITLRRSTFEHTSMLLTALDSVAGHFEIYSLDGGEYTAVFRNGDADEDLSELVSTLLNDPLIQEATALRKRLRDGESVSVTSDGLQLRPCGDEAATLLCIRPALAREPLVSAAKSKATRKRAPRPGT
jgi:PAS domain S-box-containing protein